MEQQSAKTSPCKDGKMSTEMSSSHLAAYEAEIARLRHLLAAKTIEVEQLKRGIVPGGAMLVMPSVPRILEERSIARDQSASLHRTNTAVLLRNLIVTIGSSSVACAEMRSESADIDSTIGLEQVRLMESGTDRSAEYEKELCVGTTKDEGQNIDEERKRDSPRPDDCSRSFKSTEEESSEDKSEFSQPMTLDRCSDSLRNDLSNATRSSARRIPVDHLGVMQSDGIDVCDRTVAHRPDLITTGSEVRCHTSAATISLNDDSASRSAPPPVDRLSHNRSRTDHNSLIFHNCSPDAKPERGLKDGSNGQVTAHTAHELTKESVPEKKTRQQTIRDCDHVTMDSIREGIRELKNSIRKWTSSAADIESSTISEGTVKPCLQSMQRKSSASSIDLQSTRSSIADPESAHKGNKENLNLASAAQMPNSLSSVLSNAASCF